MAMLWLIYEGILQSQALVKAQQGLIAIKRALEQAPQNDTWKKLQHDLAIKIIELNRDISIDSTDSTAIKNQIESDSFSSPRQKKELLSKYYLALAHNLQSKNLFSESEVYVDKSINNYKELSSESLSNTPYLALLSESYLMKASVLKNKSDEENTSKYCKKALENIDKIFKSNKTPQHAETYIKSLDCLGELEGNDEILNFIKKSGIKNYRF